MYVSAGVAAKLFRLVPYHQEVQDGIWGALSERLTEVSLDLTSDEDQPMRMDVLTQLTNLVSLKICMVGNRDHEVSTSYTLSHPILRSLHMRRINVRNLDLRCPRLHSLVMDYPSIKGVLSFPASLEDLSYRGIAILPFHELFPVSKLLGLTSLLCHVLLSMDRDSLYAILPSMSALRRLDIIMFNGQLPALLPSGLQAIRYFMLGEDPLSSQELQHFARACKLPELQSIGLYNCQTWTPSEISAVQKIQQESKAKVIVEENWVDEDFVSGNQTG